MRNLDCRWITCDEHFRYTVCLLKKVLVDKLYDAFDARGYEYPWCTSFTNDACNCCDGCMYENVRGEDGIKRCNPEEDDAEAEKFADELVSSLGEGYIASLYKKLLEASIENNMQELAKLNDEIAGKQKELASVVQDANEQSIDKNTRELLDVWKLI